MNAALGFGILAYTCAVGYVVYRQNRRLVCTRDKLKASEERYRLIAENVADLIGMVDNEGRWLYASPSYERVLERADLEPGVDAFLRVHPDDAARARMAVGRVAATGRSREIVLHLVDREGRMRQYKTVIQAFAGDEGAVGAPRNRLILASQDVTDLRSSEERLILQAHALEGMTEAIMITLADGTIADGQPRVPRDYRLRPGRRRRAVARRRSATPCSPRPATTRSTPRWSARATGPAPCGAVARTARSTASGAASGPSATWRM